jgi:hypothetical protein
VILSVDGLELILRLDRAGAERTRRALLRSLPMPVDLHGARIAGRHLLWHAPFVVPLEAADEVGDLPPGTFLYWPERQFLELLWGPLQAERAAVTVLGRLDGPLEPVAALGERVLCLQGRRPFRGRLEAADAAIEAAEPIEPAAAAEAPPLAALRAARRDLWARPPAELSVLLARRGRNLPAGPLLLAEAEARKLQELCWALLPHAAADPAFAGRAAAVLLEQAERRLADLYGLEASAALVALGRRALGALPRATGAILEELVLIAGRLAGWLDERTPWHGLNRAVIEAAESWADRPGNDPC